MSGEPQDIIRDERARYKPGFNTRMTKRMRTAAKVALLRAEYDPSGNGLSPIDENRLCLAAKHLIIAETCDDPTECVRSTRTAEYLLNKLRPAAASRSLTADHAAQALELLNEQPPDGV
jgi:hypothetical protein